MQTNDTVYVFEFKLNGSAEDALKQIDEKGYLIPYSLNGKRRIKIGVNFSKETRNIDKYIMTRCEPNSPSTPIIRKIPIIPKENT